MSAFKRIRYFLKNQVSLIRSTKIELKTYQKANSGNDGGYYKALRILSEDYRYHHIAYCLMRGTEYVKIENPREDHKIDMALIQRIRDAYTENVCASAE